jgi:hypothetical protein
VVSLYHVSQSASSTGGGFRQDLIKIMHNIRGKMNAPDREIQKGKGGRVEVDTVISDIKYCWFLLAATKSIR